MDKMTNRKLGKCIFRVAKGDYDALANIYLIMGRILYIVGNIYYKQRADIEDSIHDLISELVEKSKAFKNNKNAYAWIVRVYENMIKSKFKERKRENDYISGMIEKFKIDSEIDDDKYLENHIFVNEIFSRLSEFEKQLVLYRFWCKCSIGEIASILEKPKSTIEYQLKILEGKIKKM